MQPFTIRQEDLAQFLLRDEIELLSFKRERKAFLRSLFSKFHLNLGTQIILRPANSFKTKKLLKSTLIKGLFNSL